MNCLLTRHHNGFVRQESLIKIIKFDEYWITPYIFQLLGEHVVEILFTIHDNLDEQLLYNFVRFVNENSRFFKTTKSRITSCWSCYYRSQFPIKENYVGYKIVKEIENSQNNHF